MASEKEFLFEVDEGVGIVTLNRPERLNAITWDLAADLVELFRELRHRDDVRVVLLTGAGKAFCSGGDAEWISGGGERGLPGLSDVPLERYQRKTPAGPIGEFTRMIVEVDKPVIAACSGAVMGAGLAFALACDRRIADTTTRWSAGPMGSMRFAPPTVATGCAGSYAYTVEAPSTAGATHDHMALIAVQDQHWQVDVDAAATGAQLEIHRRVVAQVQLDATAGGVDLDVPGA